MEFFMSPGMTPFSAALLALCGLVLIEMALLTAGLGSAGMSDSADAGETGVAAEAEGAIGKAMAFIGFGRVPAMVVLMVLCATFGTAGTLIQMAADGLAGTALPVLPAAVLAGAASIAATSRIARLIARILPGEETAAVRIDSLIGTVAEISYGTATTRQVADARTRDAKGGVHHIQVRAQDGDHAFSRGDRVLLVSRIDGFFIGAPAPSDHQ